MALPKWMYGDPSCHVDFIRKKRREHEQRQPENKKEQARKGLKELFGDSCRETRNEQK